MIVVKLNGSNKCDLSQIEETLCPMNTVKIIREDNEYDSSGVAYKVFCKDIEIGYLADLKTLREWLIEAHRKKQGRKCKKLTDWGMATKAVRDQFKIDYENLGATEWPGQIAEIIYEKDGVTKNFLKFSELCKDGRPDGWKIQQIAILINIVEGF